LPEPPEADPDPIKVAVFQFRYCCSDAKDKARIASKVLADAGVVGTPRLVDDVDNVLGLWREFSDVLTAQLPAKKPGFTRIATTKPTNRKVTRPDKAIPLDKQANNLTSQLFRFIEAWRHTTDDFLRENPNLGEEASNSIRVIAARAADRLWERLTAWLDYEGGDS